MIDYLPFVIGVIIAAVAVTVLNRLARLVGAVARAADDRWRKPGGIPHLGGPGLLLAIFPWLPLDQGLVLAGFCVVGTIDDVRPLSPTVKALLLVFPAVAAGWSVGLAWVGLLVWFTANAVNLLDHADGLAATVAGIGFAFAATAGGLAGAGACLGFLLYNYPPARSFMGDGGSLMLGAALVLVWHDTGPMVTMAWCAVPLFDATFVTVKRLANRQKPWIGGVDHTGHMLLRAGVPPRLLPVIFGVATAIVGVVGQRVFAGA